MTTLINEMDATVGQLSGSSAGRFSFDSDRRVEAPGVEPRGAADLPLDQTFPRWLYEPVRHAIRPHLLMADLPPDRGASMAFPIDDSIAAWVWKRQEPLTINTENECRFPDFASVLLESGMKSFCGVPLIIADRPIGVLGIASTRPEAFRDFNWEFVQRGPGDTGDLAKMLRDHGNLAEDEVSGDEPF